MSPVVFLCICVQQLYSPTLAASWGQAFHLRWNIIILVQSHSWCHLISMSFLSNRQRKAILKSLNMLGRKFQKHLYDTNDWSTHISLMSSAGRAILQVHFLHHLQSTTFSSPLHKQKAWQIHQLYMQEANKGIYFTTNSLIEDCWIGQISIIKGQQNSPVQPLKSNLIGLELGKLLDLSRHLDGLNPREDVCCRLDKMTRCCSQNMTLRECQCWTLIMQDKIGVWYSCIVNAGKWRHHTISDRANWAYQL